MNTKVTCKVRVVRVLRVLNFTVKFIVLQTLGSKLLYVTVIFFYFLFFTVYDLSHEQNELM